MKIFYLVPDNNRPSWGVGMLYYHVWMLRKNNFEAYVIHNKKPFEITWLNIQVPVLFLEDKLTILEEDTLVIPEILADSIELLKFKCKKIVFVQNAFYIHEGLQKIKSYEEAKISELFYYMPHLKKILSQNYNLPIYEMPPFTAPYYFNAREDKKKRILIYPKFNNKEHEILLRILNDRINLKIKNNKFSLFQNKSNWELVELKGKSHLQVANEMRKAEFFISTNTNEAFNSSVPEAMASYCVNLCYEGVGPADFLVNNVNAFVFPNNHIFELAEKIIELVQNYDMWSDELEKMKLNAFNTVSQYTIENTEKALINYFSK
jgi:glycosyltransferase involved in cell wall biosynthesis